MSFAFCDLFLGSSLFQLQPMCHVLSIRKSSFFSWRETDHLAKEKTRHEDCQLIENAFFYLKENAEARGIKGYLAWAQKRYLPMMHR